MKPKSPLGLRRQRIRVHVRELESPGVFQLPNDIVPQLEHLVPLFLGSKGPLAVPKVDFKGELLDIGEDARVEDLLSRN